MSYDIQAHDDTDVETAVRGIIQERREQRQRRHDLDIEATVRESLNTAKEYLAHDADTASDILAEVHTILRRDDDIERILDPTDDLLEDGADVDAKTAASIRMQFKRQINRHERGQRPNVEQEFLTLLRIASALGYYSSVREMTPYAPVRLESIDEPSTTLTENPAPVGRRRLPKDTTLDPEDAAVEIPHQSCDHILCVALPRSGKDSTLTSIGMNLYREHGYKYISVFDDGRMETPMISIPTDEGVIQQNLDRLDQEPRAFDAEVFVPATPGLPDTLPSNFRQFKIGIDSLTPHLILRLAGVTTSDSTAEDRIEQALETTLENSGKVPELVGELQRLAPQQDSKIQWTEKAGPDFDADDHEDAVDATSGAGDTTETFTAHFEMSQSKALRKAAARVAKLAGDGLIGNARGPGSEKNIDMKSVIANNEQAAVLCCNFMGESKEELKYLIIDLWLRLVYKARDENSRLPRVALELRELKNIAPSKIGDVRYKDAVKTLRQTIFFLSTNGGSRRILMLGSTQKLNDVYKPVRTNMATKILLRLGEEEIETLDRSYNFSPYEREQLSGFQIGMGMVIAAGDKIYPIELRGAPCGLGLGDQHWLDRYGRARGARVRQEENDGWPPTSDDDWWVHVPDGEVFPTDETPTIGDFYSEWHLMESDFPADTAPDDVDRETIERALAERRDFETPSDISLADVDVTHVHRKLSLSSNADDAGRGVDEVIERHNIPAPLRQWIITDNGKVRARKQRRNYIEALETIRDNTLRTYREIAGKLTFSRSAFGNYLSDGGPLEHCVEQDGKEYVLTDLGHMALDIDWEAVSQECERVA
ncbi:MAG: hypothetical protein ABEJ68_08385 [Halobacteriaceae archaeon]